MTYINKYPIVLHGEKILIDKVFKELQNAGRDNDERWNKQHKNGPHFNYLWITHDNMQYHCHDCNSDCQKFITLEEHNLEGILKELLNQDTIYIVSQTYEIY